MKFLVQISNTFIFSAVVIYLTACRTTTIQFESSAPMTLVQKKFGDFNDKGTIIDAKNPVPTASLDEKMLEVNFNGQPQYYLVVWKPAGTETKLRLEPLKALVKSDAPPADLSKANNPSNSPPNNSGITPVVLNQLLRLVYGAATSLEAKNLDVAGELADKASQLSPQAALPSIIHGIVALQRNDKTNARKYFATAKALDPADQNIDGLLKMAD